ncbi:DNA adenine methylase [Bacillus alkalicellulosilyticus]|uniref:DNA adenine methylase n=1 Tax=Alkalihalobacterium alkalicellulosilyticum TaxID=1912214 RepID=UPI00099698B6|nr:DNA adenine methylase [Bacillus alkalicellulosilyticus]
MTKLEQVQPFLKWAGGKRQLLPVLAELAPAKFNRYFEPFVGAGAMLFHFQPKEAYINDINSELINVYATIRDDVDLLLEQLKQFHNDEESYYEIRALDRTDAFVTLSNIERAARIIYLNKTCYNGLFRVNSKGQFNVPFGKYKNPNIVNAEVLRAVSHYLQQNQVTISNTDFATMVLQHADKGDFVYFDPPYDPVSATSSFTSYALQGFGREEQMRLHQVFTELAQRGCYVMLSNSYTDFICDLYQDFTIEGVKATRSINSKGNLRGKIDEAVVISYDKK